MPDAKPQQMLNTENPWLNVILTLSKFISIHLYAYFQQLFQYSVHLSRAYIKTTRVNLSLNLAYEAYVNQVSKS